MKITDSVYLVATLRAVPSALQGPGHCHQHGEVRPQAYQQVSVSQSTDRHYLRESIPNRFSDCQVLSLGGQVPPSLSSSCQDVAAVVGSHGFTGTVVSQELFFPWDWIEPECTPSVASEDILVSSFGQTLRSQFLSWRSAGRASVDGLRRRDGHREFPSKCLLPLLYTNTVTTWLGVHLQDHCCMSLVS